MRTRHEPPPPTRRPPGVRRPAWTKRSSGASRTSPRPTVGRLVRLRPPPRREGHRRPAPQGRVHRAGAAGVPFGRPHAGRGTVRHRRPRCARLRHEGGPGGRVRRRRRTAAACTARRSSRWRWPKRPASSRSRPGGQPKTRPSGGSSRCSCKAQNVDQARARGRRLAVHAGHQRKRPVRHRLVRPGPPRGPGRRHRRAARRPRPRRRLRGTAVRSRRAASPTSPAARAQPGTTAPACSASTCSSPTAAGRAGRAALPDRPRDRPRRPVPLLRPLLRDAGRLAGGRRRLVHCLQADPRKLIESPIRGWRLAREGLSRAWT